MIRKRPTLAAARFQLLCRQLVAEYDGHGAKSAAARRLGIPQPHFSLLLSGKRKAKWETCEAAIDALGLSAQFFTDAALDEPYYKDHLELRLLAEADNDNALGAHAVVRMLSSAWEDFTRFHAKDLLATEHDFLLDDRVGLGRKSSGLHYELALTLYRRLLRSGDELPSGIEAKIGEHAVINADISRRAGVLSMPEIEGFARWLTDRAKKSAS